MKNVEVELGKLIILLSAIGAGITLIVKGQTAEGVSLVSLVVGYVTGNGRLISQGQAGPVPLLARRTPPPLEPPAVPDTTTTL